VAINYLVVDRIEDIKMTLVVFENHPRTLWLGEDSHHSTLIVAELVYRRAVL
jgi:hypothetical protein